MSRKTQYLQTLYYLLESLEETNKRRISEKKNVRLILLSHETNFFSLYRTQKDIARY